MVGFGGADPARGRRRALQLPGRVEAQRGRRPRKRGRSRIAAPGCSHRRMRSSGPAAHGWPSSASLAPREILDAHPHLIVTADHALRARGPVERQGRHRVHAAGVVGRRGRVLPAACPTGRRSYVGGQVGEWLSGALRGHRDPGRQSPPPRAGELVDVSMLEALAMCLTYYPVTFNDQLGRPMRRRRFIPTPGCRRRQRRARRARVRDRPAVVGLLRHGRASRVDGGSVHSSWTAPSWRRRSMVGSPPTPSRRCSTQASTFRIPNAPIANGANITTFEHFRQRETFVANPRDGAANPATAVPAGLGASARPRAGPSSRRVADR